MKSLAGLKMGSFVRAVPVAFGNMVTNSPVWNYSRVLLSCHHFKKRLDLRKKKARKFWFTTILYYLLEEETEYLLRTSICTCLVEVFVGADNKLGLNTEHPKGSSGFCIPPGSREL